MTGRLSRHLTPVLAGALVSFAVRLIFGDIQIALIGVVVFLIIYGVLGLLTRSMKRPETLMANAVIATIGTAVAFLVSRSL